MDDILNVVISLIFTLFLLIFLIRYITQKISIKRNSMFLIELQKINQKYSKNFKRMQNHFSFSYVCNSLQKYRNNCDRIPLTNYMCGIVREDADKWEDLKHKINYNRRLLKEYLEEYELLKEICGGESYDKVKRNTFLLSEKGYLKLEEKESRRILLNPVTILKIEITVSYTSPGGRNHYAKEFCMRDDFMDEVFMRIEDRNEVEKSIDYQRSLMTSGKRYDILRRDHYRCQICGRSQSDGAKLEIDHIVPVSKGGKTVDENLQTLCHDCNQGKKAKL